MPSVYKVSLLVHEYLFFNTLHIDKYTHRDKHQTQKPSPVQSPLTYNLRMTFSHGIHFLSLLEQPKDSMGGGYASKHVSTDVSVEASSNPTEPSTNGHKDDSPLPAPTELTNGHEVEESTDTPEAVAHGSKANILPGSKTSNTTIGGTEVSSVEEPATYVPKQMVAPMPGSTKLQRLLKGSNELIVCPGVYDGFSARIAMSVGFSCLYMV